MNAILQDNTAVLWSRCFCCLARALEDDRDDWQRCSWCGVRLRRRGLADFLLYAEELRALLEPGRALLPALGECDWFVDSFTLRIAATARELWFAPDPPHVIKGHDDARPEGRLRSLRRALPADVALAIIARADDPRLSAVVTQNAPNFAETVVVIDGPLDHDTEAALAAAGAALVRRPLEGDFGAQRDAAMDAVTREWAFHLDLDEEVTPRFVALLSSLAVEASEAGLRAIGFARRNYVDGALSDAFPDIQYRLVAKGTRFIGRVHERPDACENWPRTTIALTGTIDHHLDRARVLERTRRYETLGQHADRRDDEAQLLRRFRG